MSRQVRATLVALLLVVLFLPVTSQAGPSQQSIKVSAPFKVAGGEGNQLAPTLAGNTLAYTDCVSSWTPCALKVMDVQSGQSYTIPSDVPTHQFGSSRRTDGATAAWADVGGKSIFGANLSDNSSFLISSALSTRLEPSVLGNIVVWTDYRNADPNAEYPSGDIYMYDLNTRRESRLSPIPGEQSHPATNGKVVVWLDQGQPSSNPVDFQPTTIRGYDLATGKEFTIVSQSSYRSEVAVSGNIVVWLDHGNPSNPSSVWTTSIYMYDLVTKKSSQLVSKHEVDLGLYNLEISGTIVVWVQEVQVPGGERDIYGYDLNSKQSFPISVGGDAWHYSPSISGNTVVWVDDHYGGGTSDIMGAKISGVAIAPIGLPAPKPAPTSRTFHETGKTVAGRFLDYWLKNGGLPQQGFPISTEMKEVSDLDGKQYTVQYFERAVFEMHTENKPPYDVLLSQLGAFRLKQKYPDPARVPGNISGWGTITGNLQYPSEGIPPLDIYAIPTGKEGKYFSVRTWFDQLDFALQGVEPGTYYVLAYSEEVPSVETDFQPIMAYTKAVQCATRGPNAVCNDHSLATITVKAGDILQDISPIEFLFDDVRASLPSRPGHADAGTCRTFKETGKLVCGKFLSYWLTHGGLPQQGYPISNTFTEVSDLDGKPYTVQYFERAVFEWHPENIGSPYEVLLSQLGTFQYIVTLGALNYAHNC
jgi:TolB protein